ncbi:MAG: hypothetical protein ACJ75R_04050 [Solirubrobacterales bacterium]
MPIACTVFGHRVRFWTEAETMRWECERGCGFGGRRTYPTAADAARYAVAFDREDADNLGRRAPVSLFPLRLVRRRDKTP